MALANSFPSVIHEASKADFNKFVYFEVFAGENYYADFIDDDTSTAIAFDWELPWLDAGNRIKTNCSSR
jgi:hypothetical protein